MADAIEDAVEIKARASRVFGGIKADVALAEFSAGNYFGLQFAILAVVVLTFAALAKEEALADADFAAGADQAFPIVRLG